MEMTKIVITGGPCAGKSEAMKWVKSTFSEKGYTALFIPETATELITGGVAPWTCGTNLDYQILQCQLQMEKERIFKQAALTMKQDKFLIVCDRGLLDNKAYMTDKEYEKVLETLNTTEEDILSSYDAIFHMVTAAKGLEQFYTLENNEARIETAQEAAILDDKILDCWKNHPNLKIINNAFDFDSKMQNLVDEITNFLESKE